MTFTWTAREKAAPASAAKFETDLRLNAAHILWCLQSINECLRKQEDGLSADYVSTTPAMSRPREF